MSASVTLTVTRGPLKGERYSFDERTTLIIGRGVDCYPRLPDDEFHRTISRNHCLLDINPPAIRIRDFGSLNGSRINGSKIGQRSEPKPGKDSTASPSSEYDLKDGDEIGIGGTVFKVSLETEIVNISDTDDDMAPDQAKTPVAPPLCAGCGKRIEEAVIVVSDGDRLCDSCRADPLSLIKSMLSDPGENSKTLISGYSIIRKLGQGGMGMVYLAEEEDTGERVALKVMLPEVATENRARNMFMREVENTSALDHPNIVRLKGSGYRNGVFFFTMEYCDGGAVDHFMELNGGKLSVETALKITLQALDGLEYAHNAPVKVTLANGNVVESRGIVHRDIKPANIFLAGSGENMQAKIADVGLGKAFDMAGLSGQTRTGVAVGTPYFMPRQQLVNFKYAKPDVDVWGIAASLYNMLTGKAPRFFAKGKDPWQIVLQTSAVPIREREPDLPGKLADLIDTALVDQPDIKFKTAAELKKALIMAR